LALVAARQKKRVLALTVDPARRLVTSLGLSKNAGEPQSIDETRLAEIGIDQGGSLAAMILDPKGTFDRLVERYASSKEARQRIFDNPLYHYLSTKLAGTSEYMAMEKLLELKESQSFDLIVLDTPPTPNALDFLSAPDRMIEALDSRTTRWFIQAFDSERRLSLGLLGRSVAQVLKGMGRITSSGFLTDLAALIADLNDLFGGFRERALRVSATFRAEEVGYVLITSLDAPALEEARQFAEHLASQKRKPDLVVINRARSKFLADVGGQELASALAGVGVALDTDAEARITQVLEEERAWMELEQSRLERAQRLAGDAPLILVPALPGDVHDLKGLAQVAELVAASERVSAPR
jgi:anion-transporting  ArsA/GET3 family ATPase